MVRERLLERDCVVVVSVVVVDWENEWARVVARIDELIVVIDWVEVQGAELTDIKIWFEVQMKMVIVSREVEVLMYEIVMIDGQCDELDFVEFGVLEE